ncbi:hypothetical protein [uncultured Algibacter sp.]|uniref:hypothetical protein n=1 Tax=uncultured Algibacter sp. TaxID=298659 RepID=UPI002609EFC9|nr:hypothetical protein [uncultured Algibacter sp.]
MKKLMYIALGIIIGVLLTYYFYPPLDNSGETETVENKIVKPDGVITVEEAIELNNNWTKFRKPAVDSAAARQGREIDKRSVGWSVEDVRNYLDWAEVESENLGYSMDSIRVYLGVYGNREGKENDGFTTMFMAPIGLKLNAEAGLSSSSFIQSGVGPLNNGSGGNQY